MAKGTKGPMGRGGRPPGRIGKGGVGPGPAYRGGSHGRGTRHGGGSTGSKTMVWVAVAIWAPPVLAFAAAVGYLVSAS